MTVSQSTAPAGPDLLAPAFDSGERERPQQARDRAHDDIAILAVQSSVR